MGDFPPMQPMLRSDTASNSCGLCPRSLIGRELFNNQASVNSVANCSTNIVRVLLQQPCNVFASHWPMLFQHPQDRRKRASVCATAFFPLIARQRWSAEACRLGLSFSLAVFQNLVCNRNKYPHKKFAFSLVVVIFICSLPQIW